MILFFYEMQRAKNSQDNLEEEKQLIDSHYQMAKLIIKL